MQGSNQPPGGGNKSGRSKPPTPGPPPRKMSLSLGMGVSGRLEQRLTMTPRIRRTVDKDTIKAQTVLPKSR